MRVIPAIDIIDGKCVRLSRGDYSARTDYATSPLEMAKQFEAAGVERLHLVDLDGAKAGVPKNISVLEELAAATTLRIDFSGGIRQTRDVLQVFDAGAQFVAIGSAAVKQPELVEEWVNDHGAHRFIIGADVAEGRKIAIAGWTEVTDITLHSFIASWEGKGVTTFLCTAIERDGLLEGADFSLYRDLAADFPKSTFIVSGGVSSLAELRRLAAAGASDVIVGKALYEGRINIESLREFSC